MHRRAAASSSAAVPSSKVVASRERRAARKLQNGGGIRTVNGHLPHHTKYNSHDKGSGRKGVILLVAIGAIFVLMLLVWGGALYHVTSSDAEDDGSDTDNNNKKWKFGRVSLPKNPLRRIRNGDTNHYHSMIDPNQNPYTPEALQKNPYLGWQPKHVTSPLGSSFSVRECFKAEPKSDGSDQPAGCNENPAELGTAPSVDKGWIPDVTMIRTMMMHGKDRDGNVFPPQLSKELCEDIAVTGGKAGDTNKECVKESNIRAVGTLNSTTVTINPSNHYEAENSNTDEASVVVPAPKLMCLVYTMADAHANRVRTMRDTWAGGCDGFLAFSTASDPRLPAISLEHEGPESYDNVSIILICVAISAM